MNYKLVAYSIDFVSFLIEKLNKEAEKIKSVILFGSVTRGEAEKESDIDIFIEGDEKLEIRIKKLKEKFENSVKVKSYWSLLDVKNEINIHIGRLEEWKDLKRSIIANGIVLYGRYLGRQELVQHYLFIVSPGKDRNKNVSIWRDLYGYTQKVGKKSYIKKGLIREYGGKKLARGVFAVPIENAQKTILYLRKKRLKVQIIPFWTDNEISVD